jgi:sugar phosphate isomerase/epimerase
MWYYRKLCGEGEQDVSAFIRAIHEAGFRGVWGIEMISEEFRQWDLEKQVARSYETTRQAIVTALATS